MSKRIKTHFDFNVRFTFVIIFLLSLGLMGFQMKKSYDCSVNDFVISSDELRVGSLLSFADTTANAYQWRWDFGDGNISYRSKVSHQYNEPGKYLVKLKVNEGCEVEKWIMIKEKNTIVDSLLFPAFSIIAPKKIFVGDKIKFIDTTDHATSWEWRFENGAKVGSTEKSPEYSFYSPGEKVVSLVVNNNPEYVTFKKVTVLPKKKSARTFQDIRMDRLSRRPSVDPVEAFLQSLPDTLSTEREEPERVVPEMNEEIFKGCMEGIAKGRLSYYNFTSLFCKDQLPTVLLEDGTSRSLVSLYNTVKQKGRVRVKSVALSRNSEGCVDVVHLDYR